MKEQNILLASEDYAEIDKYIKDNAIQSILLVCDGSIRFLRVNEYFKRLESAGDANVFRFSDFQPNPLYESVVKGVNAFLTNGCDTIWAVGGGSAMDVAKCIKLYSNMDHTKNYLQQEIVPNDVKLLALPTTAGTGSEATRYAVIYYEDAKQSVTHESIIPSTVVFDPSVLASLPVYQKKATLMDALCHSIESFWSVNSSEQSKQYSAVAIRLIMENWREYIAGNNEKNEVMLQAANIAGKAINITQTTAGHAMCYKLTSLYGIAHGHAAALCVPALWEYMSEHLENSVDHRGPDYVRTTFEQIAEAMGCKGIKDAIASLRNMMVDLELVVPNMGGEEDFEILKKAVNPVRLKNNPVGLSEEVIDGIYHTIFEGAGR